MKEASKVYKTYIKEYEKQKKKSKSGIWSSKLNKNEFKMVYTDMYDSASTPSEKRHVIQTLVKEQKEYVFSKKQAKGIQAYFKEKGKNKKIYDIMSNKDLKKQVSIIYNDLKKQGYTVTEASDYISQQIFKSPD